MKNRIVRMLLLDYETRSSVNIAKAGVYRYTESPDWAPLLLSVSVNGGPTVVYDIANGEEPPVEILKALVDPDVVKLAHNAVFERIATSVYLRRWHPEYFHGYGTGDDTVGGYLDPRGWHCSMVWASYLGLPLSLESVGAVLGFEKQKLKEGKDLIRYFCTPCKPTVANGGRCWHTPEDAPEKWELFKSYNKRDTEVEVQIYERLSRFPIPDFIWKQYWRDQTINDRGILIDPVMVQNAIKISEISKNSLTEKLQVMTHLDNPNSVAQMKQYLISQGVHAESLGKKQVAALIPTVSPEVAEVLVLRQQISKSSVKKYEAMENVVCEDGRCRGLFQFWGTHTGRWAGRLIQLQNLPQNHLPDLEQARNLVKDGDYEMLSILYDNVPAVLSELIRTAFVARDGYKFIVADYSAIEARVLSYLAGETWRSEVFRTGGDIYCESASHMFGVPVVKHGVNGELRQKGKIAELALGYGGSVGALKQMGAIEMGLTEDELQPLVNSWRSTNPRIVEYWWTIDRAIKTAIKKGVKTSVGPIDIWVESQMLFIRLPSGRCIVYPQPAIGTNKYGTESITYAGTDTAKKWTRVESYGPKFVENIVQAYSRDVLANAMANLSDRFICAHVHDELIIEAPEDTDLQTICNIMGQTPGWAPGLILRADGYETPFYKKD